MGAQDEQEVADNCSLGYEHIAHFANMLEQGFILLFKLFFDSVQHSTRRALLGGFLGFAKGGGFVPPA